MKNPFNVLPCATPLVKFASNILDLANEKGSLLRFIYIFGRVARQCCQLPPSDVILAQLACPLSDVMFCLDLRITDLSLQTLDQY